MIHARARGNTGEADKLGEGFHGFALVGVNVISDGFRQHKKFLLSLIVYRI